MMDPSINDKQKNDMTQDVGLHPLIYNHANFLLAFGSS